ncbi:TonB-dependent receptor [Granulicella rosea]|nr:carboxypeptidase regulatory-like domain-containing protein [Granulicella rosea]
MAYAQTTTATLSGNVVDDSGAIVPGADVTLVNAGNGSVRSTKSNSGGSFVFAAVPTGDYTVTVKFNGFKSNVIKGIHLNPQDTQNLTKIMLQVGEVTQVIDVTTSDAGLSDSGERSTLITAKDIAKLSVEGRDVGELVKMLPGFAIAQTSGAIDNTAYDPGQVSVTGALRSYAANGNAANGVTLLSDGANVSDPGNYGDSTQNVNSDMVEEVKVQTSNFTAETSNGPIVVNAVGKSGTKDFHGALYAYARTYQLNAQDWLSKYEGQLKPADRYVYPGGNISGPLVIPGTNFNHAKKLTFFAGAEDYAQRNIYAYGSASQAIAHALVPTAAMRKGDFSCTSLQAYLGSSIISGCNANGSSTIANASYNNIATVPTQTRDAHTVGNGQIASTYFDPGALALLNTLPLPNSAPLNGFNYFQTNLVNNNLWQGRTRVDYSFSEKVKLFATYNIERGSQGVPEVPYYSPSQTAPMGGIDTPGGGLLSTVNSQTGGLNLTVILSPRMTNELQANMTWLHQAFVPKTPSALLKTTIGYPTSYYGLSDPTTGKPISNSTQFPQLSDYGTDGLPLNLAPDFSVGEPYARKTLPSVADNFTFAVKSHTLKAGAYVQKVINNQRLSSAVSSTSGRIANYYFGSTFQDPDGTTVFTSGNYLANFLQGMVEQFNQQNIEPQQNLYFWNINWYVTDSWKIVPRLTVDYGIRFEHLGPWQDAHGQGIAVFDPTTAGNPNAAHQGYTYHGIDKTVPNSGVAARFAFYEPRVGIAFDPYGNGKTMIRGGWGMYRNHDNWNVIQLPAAQAQGVTVTSVSGGAGIDLKQIGASNVSGTVGAGNFSSGSASANNYVVDRNDNEQPLTYTYSFTVDQELPKNVHFEIAYTGNQGRYQTAQNVNNLTLSLQNINPVPRGAFFQPDPVTGAVTPLGAIDSLSTAQVNDYRPYSKLGNIYEPRHNLYSYYNGLQTSLNKQSGHLSYGVNYTWSKALGIKDGFYNGNAVDATNLRNNYGVLSFDRTHIFNASYSYDEGAPYKGERVLRYVLNNWAVSGITGLQSGPNLQATYYANFNLVGKLGPSGGTQLNVDNKTFLGTPDVQLQPLTTCNPGQHTAPNQFVNGNCFQLPQIGQNGPFNYPYIHGPAFFNSDLTLARNIPMGEKRNLQFRFAAFNFLNHPLTSFSTSFPQQVQLNLSNLSSTGYTANPATATPAPGFGVSTIKEGRRVVEIAAKYTF